MQNPHSGVLVVPQVPKHLVTRGAEKTTDALPAGRLPLTACVVVIDTELTLGPSCTLTYGTNTALKAVDVPILIIRNIVGIPDVPLMTVRPPLIPFESVVCGASWTRVRCLSFAPFVTIYAPPHITHLSSPLVRSSFTGVVHTLTSL